jgi:hypothetical protein
MRLSLLCLAASASVAIFVAAPSSADNPGMHPAYLHALSDLRDARARLEHSASDPAAEAESHAIEKINMAIDEIKRAAIDDGKGLNDHPSLDAQLPGGGRIHHALELLEKAKKDAAGEEDQADTRGLQQRVIARINDAEASVRHAIEIIEGR